MSIFATVKVKGNCCSPINNCSEVVLCLDSGWEEKTVSGFPLVIGKVTNITEKIVDTFVDGCYQSSSYCEYTVDLEDSDQFLTEELSGFPYKPTSEDVLTLSPYVCVTEALMVAIPEPLNLTGVDTDAIHTDVTGTYPDLMITSELILSEEDGNIAVINEDGLFVPSDPGSVLELDTQDSAAIDLTVLGAFPSLTIGAELVLSEDAGNIAVIHADGLYVPEPPEELNLVVEDTDAIDLEITGTYPDLTITAELLLSDDAGNVAEIRADGLYVPTDPGAVLNLADDDSTSIDVTISGTFPDIFVGAAVILSAEVDNALTIEADGLYTPEVTITADDNASVNTTIAGTFPDFIVGSDVVLSGTAGNVLTIDGTGVYSPTVALTADDNPSVNTTITGTFPNFVIGSDVILSADPGNTLTIEADGLMSTAIALNPTVVDTDAIDLTLTWSSPDLEITADLLLSADSGNVAEIRADGLYVPTDPGAILNLLADDTDSIDVTISGTFPDITVSADLQLSPDDGNRAEIRGDGLYVPGDYEDGWIPIFDSVTYNSANKVNVPSGAASRYRVGDKFKYTQTTVKYAYIVDVTDTTLTIYGGTSYVLANAAITDPHYSHQQTPVGFPHVFTFTADLTFNGFSTPPTFAARFSIIGRDVFVNVDTTTNGTSNSTSFTITLPSVLTSASSGPKFNTGGNDGTDNGAYQSDVRVQLPLSSTTITVKRSGGAVSTWTASGAKGVNFNLNYTIDG